MPYIAQQTRAELDAHIETLAKAVQANCDPDNKAGFAGLLNYVCTKLALEVIPERRYWAVATTSGVFSNIADEFYRRYATPYEDEQIAKNGDVY